MSAADPVELLSRVPLFSELSRDELERISRVAVPRVLPGGGARLPRGRPLATPATSSAPATCGSPASTPTAARSRSRRWARATSSASWRCSTAQARSASVETLTDCRAARPARRRTSGACSPSTREIAAKLIVALTRRLRETNERVARQSFQTVPSRVAGRARAADRRGGDRRRGAAAITVRMTQADLAQLAGTSRESVSRFLATLERAGVVAVGRGRVTVLEPRRLRAYIF